MMLFLIFCLIAATTSQPTRTTDTQNGELSTTESVYNEDQNPETSFQDLHITSFMKVMSYHIQTQNSLSPEQSEKVNLALEEFLKNFAVSLKEAVERQYKDDAMERDSEIEEEKDHSKSSSEEKEEEEDKETEETGPGEAQAEVKPEDPKEESDKAQEHQEEEFANELLFVEIKKKLMSDSPYIKESTANEIAKRLKENLFVTRWKIQAIIAGSDRKTQEDLKPN